MSDRSDVGGGRRVDGPPGRGVPPPPWQPERVTDRPSTTAGTQRTSVSVLAGFLAGRKQKRAERRVVAGHLAETESACI